MVERKESMVSAMHQYVFPLKKRKTGTPFQLRFSSKTFVERVLILVIFSVCCYSLLSFHSFYSWLGEHPFVALIVAKKNESEG